MRTYREVLDKITSIDVLLNELRVDIEDLQSTIKVATQFPTEETYMLDKALGILRTHDILKPILTEVLLAQHATKYKKEHGYKTTRMVLK